MSLSLGRNGHTTTVTCVTPRNLNLLPVPKLCIPHSHSRCLLRKALSKTAVRTKRTCGDGNENGGYSWDSGNGGEGTSESLCGTENVLYFHGQWLNACTHIFKCLYKIYRLYINCTPIFFKKLAWGFLLFNFKLLETDWAAHIPFFLPLKSQTHLFSKIPMPDSTNAESQGKQKHKYI